MTGRSRGRTSRTQDIRGGNGNGDDEFPHSPPRVISGNGDGNGNDSPAVGASRGAMRGRRTLETLSYRTRPSNLTSKKGISGIKVALKSNYFPLISQPNWALYMYHVSFEPEEDRTVIKKALLRAANSQNVLRGYIFDGANLFTSYRLPQDPVVLNVVSREEKHFQITIKLTKDISLDDPQYMHFFNILMRKCLDHLKLQQLNRNFYDPAAKIELQNERVSIWPGYVTTIRQHEYNAMLCCEISHKIMRTISVLDCLSEAFRNRPNDYQAEFQRKVLGTIVLTDYNNKTYRIDDIDWKVSPSSNFEKKDKSRITYVEYYKNRYNIRIHDLNQPLLVSRSKPREVRSGMPEMVYLVPELCKLTGLTDDERNNFNFMKSLADYTKVGPVGRIKKLMDFSRRIRNTPAISKELADWDLKFSEKIIEFDGRVLPSEKISQGSDRSQSYLTEGSGDFSKSMREKHMVSNGQMNKWVVIVPSKLKNDTRNLVNSMQRAANGMGFNIPHPQVQEMRDDRVTSYVENIGAAAERFNPDLMFVITQSNKLDKYAAIKKKCSVHLGIPSQVVTAKNVRAKSLMTVATKIAIQINCKTGGAPWTVDMPMGGVMIIGYDVSHEPGQKSKSVGAFVASLDKYCTRYFSAVSLHDSGEEISTNIATNMVKAIREFQKVPGNNDAYPTKFFIYRDGVSDGQIPYIHEHEIQLILKKLKPFYKNESPKLAYIIVNKRINTRVFTADNDGNPSPGTVIDDVITYPERYDFLLVSQCVRQGTVSPTSYNVIFDTSGLPPDRMQRFTYKLNHLYYNWSGTVRVPAPCQYAHKLAFLVTQALDCAPHQRLENLLHFL